MRAYAEGIEDHLRPIFNGTIRVMVNHDLTGSFCVWLNLVFNDRVLILEIGATGVAIADIEHYRDRAAWEEKREGSPPEPKRLDYADPRLMQQVEASIKEYFECPEQQ